MNALLTGSRIFAGLEGAALSAVQRSAHVRRADEGQPFVSQGEPALAFYLLSKGYAKISQVTPDGHQTLIRYIGPGEEFGLVAVLSGFDYPASVEAATASEALAWEGELLAQLMERFPTIGFNALHVLAEQNQDLQRRYNELLTERVEQRMALALLRLARQAGRATAGGTQIDLPISHEDLSEMAGTNIYTVSRVLRRWAHDGIVETGRMSLLLLRPGALEHIAAPE